MWQHNYDPLDNFVLSTLVAALPIFVLLLLIGILRKPAWMSALAGLAAGLVVAIVAYGMPVKLAVSSSLMGAAFGWDFVEPVAMYSYRGERNLFYHVKFRPQDAVSKGLQMPALSHMSEADAAAVWQWLRAVATHPMPGYAP